MALWTGATAVGCTRSLGTASGLLGTEAYPPAMVLATGASGEDCGTSLFLVPLRRPALEVAVARALAGVPEATLLTDAHVEATSVTTVVYNRTCLRVRGSAAKLVSTFVVPAPPGGAHGGHH
jgi:hypothetical protein